LETGEIIRLFNPRLDEWHYHFRWEGPMLVGLTSVARATIETLKINHADAIFARAALIAEGAMTTSDSG
jgi:hypothetical protein